MEETRTNLLGNEEETERTQQKGEHYKGKLRKIFTHTG